MIFKKLVLVFVEIRHNTFTLINISLWLSTPLNLKCALDVVLIMNESYCLFKNSFHDG